MRLRDWRTVASDMLNSCATSLVAMPSTTRLEMIPTIASAETVQVPRRPMRRHPEHNRRLNENRADSDGTSVRQAARTNPPVPATPEHPAAPHVAAGWIGWHCWIGPRAQSYRLNSKMMSRTKRFWLMSGFVTTSLARFQQAVFLCRMDIHVRRMARKCCRNEGYCASKSFVHGTLSGEDSDMNVQATGIAFFG